jgi:hypothetical protein
VFGSTHNGEGALQDEIVHAGPQEAPGQPDVLDGQPVLEVAEPRWRVTLFLGRHLGPASV